MVETEPDARWWRPARTIGRVTAVLVGLLTGWFALELVAFATLPWTGEEFGYWLSSNPSQLWTPGTVFAPLSHAGALHFLANVGVISLYGTTAESHLSRQEFLAFVVVVGYGSLHASSLLTMQATMGASAAALGLVGFYHTHLLLAHRDDLVFYKTDGKVLPTDAQTRQLYLGLVSLLGPPAIAGWSVLQAFGVVDAGRADPLGHLLGLLLGVTYALGRAVVTRTRSASS